MTDFWTRMTELSRLQPGWLDGEGLPPTEQALKAAGRIATALPTGADPIRAYPTPQGGVELEWNDANLNHSITIGPDLRLDLTTIDRDELTREEAVALTDDLGNQLYRAEDRVAFVREMLAGRTEPVDPATVLAWLDHQHCPRVESEQQQIARLTAERDQYAAGIPLICTDERHEAKVRGLEALLAAGQKATEHWEGAYTREVAVHGQTERTLREARNQRGSALMVTDHTYEGEPGHGQHCETERFGQTCGAPWEQHQLREEPSP